MEVKHNERLDIDREKASQYLENQDSGDYIIRKGNGDDNPFCLSIKTSDTVINLKISYDSQDWGILSSNYKLQV